MILVILRLKLEMNKDRSFATTRSQTPSERSQTIRTRRKPGHTKGRVEGDAQYESRKTTGKY
ncbi:hypothetical protein DPMN_171201 [Dreissena polymorpha]|uniref:Uncharacterized protein n=1 Tax=Dreissena polymorpha TaxID=45954 RepID=A0A9D4E0P8_DREPO|nr:hypothetical protein DPMN_171201 [Dreissena polymorpha]